MKTGFSPAIYVAKRSEADHHRAKKENMPLYLFDLKVSGNWDGKKQLYWGEFDLSKVWDIGELQDPKSLMILA